MIDLGISGWMADFGEYLPTDTQLYDGSDAKQMHNAWPTLWAKVNAEAIAEAGRTGDVLFFMRAGYTGVQRYCPLLWAGDQSVDFSRHDGLVSAICAALSSGLLGNAYHHSDIGGYTSLFGNRRTPELLMRWAEMAAFTPVMRTHETNRPEENCQFDDDCDGDGAFRAHDPHLLSSRALSAGAGRRGQGPRSAGAAPAVPALRGRPAHPHDPGPVPLWAGPPRSLSEKSEGAGRGGWGVI